MKSNVDYLIIGAGPAGLQLGYFLEKQQRDYLILEQSDSPGAFFKTFPRHRMLISINKVHTGTENPEVKYRWDWNSLLCDDEALLFKNYSRRYFPDASVLVQYLADFAARYELNIAYNTAVAQISRDDAGGFRVTAADGRTFTGKRLIVATGLSKSHVPDFPGAEWGELYSDHDVNPEKYIDKRVLIVGKGNSAFETAENLVETAAVIHVCAPETLQFAWQTHYVGHLRAVNNNFLDTYQLKSQNALVDATVDKIEKQGGKLLVHMTYIHAKGQTAVVEYDHVIFCTGFHFDSSIFAPECKPELIYMGKFPAQTAEWESANVPGLYFAGTLMHGCDYRRTMSGFIHGFRHNIKSLAHLFDLKYHNTPWPNEELVATPHALCNQVIEQVNIESAMFLQPGFLCDVVVVDEANEVANYYTDVRRDYAVSMGFNDRPHYYTISLEYGHFEGNPFDIERDPDPDKGHEAAYLHPVIRRYNYDQLVAEHHIQDDLENNFYKDVYVKPVLAWFEIQLASRVPAEAEVVMG
ncbi:MAG: NAD(P)-binding domain-containing protein [Anaerolineae bacterium]|nr:NAD(P)-binding domain-containing protein [Anaerolineae bacterium]